MNTINENTKKVGLLTVKDVQAKLNVSRQTVYLLTKEGKLPAIKIRDCVRYKAEDVEKLITEGVSEVSPEKIPQ